MKNKRIVVALGGNAILSGDASERAQKDAIRDICKKLVNLTNDGNQLIVSHGNGPQVGNLLLQQQAADSLENPALSLDSCVAMTQGSIGYWLQNEMSSVLHENGINRTVVSLVTQVCVDKNDEAFSNPTKPIGPFLTKEDADLLSAENSSIYKEDSGRGYRKVVASPKPIDIVEYNAVVKLIENDIITISCGGGGIPVILTENGYKGIEAVIDKDLVSEKLAQLVEADLFIILTGVDNVFINYNKPNQEKLTKVNVSKLKEFIAEGQFAQGSMLPKIEAAISFVEASKSGVAIITSLEKLGEINEGAGTVITKYS